MSKKNFKKSARQSVASAFFSAPDREDIQDVQDTSSVVGAEDVQDVSDREEKKKLENKEEGISGTQDSKDTKDIQSVSAVLPEESSLPQYRINLRLKGEFRDYLDQVSWENRTSITQYLNDLIEKDRKEYLKKNPDKHIL